MIVWGKINSLIGEGALKAFWTINKMGISLLIVEQCRRTLKIKIRYAKIIMKEMETNSH